MRRSGKPEKEQPYQHPILFEYESSNSPRSDSNDSPKLIYRVPNGSQITSGSDPVSVLFTPQPLFSSEDNSQYNPHYYGGRSQGVGQTNCTCSSCEMTQQTIHRRKHLDVCKANENIMGRNQDHQCDRNERNNAGCRCNPEISRSQAGYLQGEDGHTCKRTGYYESEFHRRNCAENSVPRNPQRGMQACQHTNADGDVPCQPDCSKRQPPCDHQTLDQKRNFRDTSTGAGYVARREKVEPRVQSRDKWCSTDGSSCMTETDQNSRLNLENYVPRDTACMCQQHFGAKNQCVRPYSKETDSKGTIAKTFVQNNENRGQNTKTIPQNQENRSQNIGSNTPYYCENRQEKNTRTYPQSQENRTQNVGNIKERSDQNSGVCPHDTDKYYFMPYMSEKIDCSKRKNSPHPSNYNSNIFNQDSSNRDEEIQRGNQDQRKADKRPPNYHSIIFNQNSNNRDEEIPRGNQDRRNADKRQPDSSVSEDHACSCYRTALKKKSRLGRRESLHCNSNHRFTHQMNCTAIDSQESSAETQKKPSR